MRESGFVCEACGDVRFVVPCKNCSGSRKVCDEDEGLEQVVRIAAIDHKGSLLVRGVLLAPLALAFEGSCGFRL
ncbi:Glutaredoxin family protein [Tripterygium wilfordii]|uniref:Glutaredoxin family protein n=1 Tax=Tripterygium wilfordii TaxID=458696 RepID=A0A7J7CHU9_TRIWF|nr:Glutaredoxin family protein [Tripterygium wilfordii]